MASLPRLQERKCCQKCVPSLLQRTWGELEGTEGVVVVVYFWSSLKKKVNLQIPELSIYRSVTVRKEWEIEAPVSHVMV